MVLFELTSVAIFVLVILYIGFLIGKYIAKRQHEDKIPDIREDAINRSRAVLSGQFSEQLAPYLPNFPFRPSEARFIGKPIDFVVFKGMDEKKIEQVVFVEVKSGQSKLTDVQKSLKSTIQNKNVSWFEYKVPEEIVKKPIRS